MTLRRWQLDATVGVLVMAWARVAAAYRPFDGTDADIAEPGEVELEIGPAGYSQEGSSRFIVAPAVVANYGFAPGLEAVVEGRQEFPVPEAQQLWAVGCFVKGLLRRGSLQGNTGPSVAL